MPALRMLKTDKGQVRGWTIANRRASKRIYTVPFFARIVERKAMASPALLFALTTFILWGTTNFLIAYGQRNTAIDPGMFTALMWVTIGVIGIVLIVYLHSTGKTIPMNSALVYPIAAGLFLGIGILTLSYALSKGGATAGSTAAIATSNAVLTSILALAFMQEKMQLKEWVGVFTVVLGIVILRI
jgi:drug/metabolite transporter (DMT)-like permease